SSGLMPSWARLQPAQNSGTVVPIGVTTPTPVTTTRCGTPAPCICTLSRPLGAYGGAWRFWRGARSGLGRCGTRAGDQSAHAIHDRAYGLEVGRFLVGVIGDLDAERVLDVEHDHRQVEGLDLEIGQRHVGPIVVDALCFPGLARKANQAVTYTQMPD